MLSLFLVLLLAGLAPCRSEPPASLLADVVAADDVCQHSEQQCGFAALQHRAQVTSETLFPPKGLQFKKEPAVMKEIRAALPEAKSALEAAVEELAPLEKKVNERREEVARLERQFTAEWETRLWRLIQDRSRTAIRYEDGGQEKYLVMIGNYDEATRNEDCTDIRNGNRGGVYNAHPIRSKRECQRAVEAFLGDVLAFAGLVNKIDRQRFNCVLNIKSTKGGRAYLTDSPGNSGFNLAKGHFGAIFCIFDQLIGVQLGPERMPAEEDEGVTSASDDVVPISAPLPPASDDGVPISAPLPVRTAATSGYSARPPVDGDDLDE